MDNTTKDAWTGKKKDLSPEALEKRNEINKKILKFGCLPIIGLIILISIFSESGSDNNSNTNSAKTEQTEASTPAIDLKTKIINNIKSIDGGDDLTKTPLTSAEDFIIAVAIFKAYAITINEGKQSTDKEILKLTDELEKKVIASQKKNFPMLRKAYFEFVKNKLWENDIYVTLSGNNNTLQLTGVYFAANKNIKTTQETLYEMLTLLRFKQTQYRWYKGQDEFTYYDIESPKDNEIIE